MLELLHHPVYSLFALSILGLCIGSFLNVVILRLPAMLQHGWQEQCRELLGTSPEEGEPSPEKLGLAFPASHCPSCKEPLKFWHNIPIVSYLLLKGKCAFCSDRIPIRYPLIELITAIATLHLTTHFGITWQLPAALLFVWALICLTVIDIDHQLLPDDITIPLVWLGLLVNYFTLFSPLDDAVIGAICGYMSFWLVFQIHYRITGRQGLGYGDFKLLAALGAWLGWQALPLIILLSSVTGILAAIVLMVSGRLNTRGPISYGPFLAAAGWAALLWGDDITAGYLRLMSF